MDTVRESLAGRMRYAAIALAALLVIARPLIMEIAYDGSSLWIAQGWFAVGIMWVLSQVFRRQLVWKFHVMDALVLALATVVAISTLNALARRPAINLAWEWAALSMMFFMMRQLPQTRSENHVLSRALLALTITFSGYGLYDYFWLQPRDEQEYLENQSRFQRQLGLRPGSDVARRFEDRLLYSHEPLVTFALTNSLAGFMVPWFVVLVAWSGCSLLASRHKSLMGMVLMTTFVLMMVLCLYLTKSRTAWLATFAGVGVWLLFSEGSRVRIWFLVLSCIAVVIVTAVSILGRGFDHLIVTTAGLSLSYRMQYWTGTWRLIKEYFWWGVGPGNFQQHYISYKLPEASEEIADAHNMFLEMWSTSGFFAALLLLLILGVFGVAIWRSVRVGQSATQHSGEGDVCTPSSFFPFDQGILIAGGAGFLMIFVFGLVGLIPFEEDGRRLFSLGLGWLCTYFVLRRYLTDDTFVRSIIPVAVMALVLNLSAAGSLYYPSVSQNLWILLAVGLNLGLRREQRLVIRNPVGMLVSSGMALGLFVGSLVMAASPATAVRAELNLSEFQIRNRKPEAAERHLRNAIEMDPISPVPLKMLADLRFHQWRSLEARRRIDKDSRLIDDVGKQTPLRPVHQQAEQLFKDGMLWAEQSVALDRNRASAHWWIASHYLEYHYVNQDASSAKKAASRLSDYCLVLYPHHAAYTAAYAESLRLLGEKERGRIQAMQALELLRNSIHVDKRTQVVNQFKRNVNEHPRSPVRLAEWAYAMYLDAQSFDPDYKGDRVAIARQQARHALSLDLRDNREDSLHENHRKFIQEILNP